MRKSNFKTFELVNFNNNNYSDVINLPYIFKISLFKTNMMRLRTKITLWCPIEMYKHYTFQWGARNEIILS